MSFDVINLSSHSAPEAKENKQKEWVEYIVKDNDDYKYPNGFYHYLMDRSMYSPTNGAIINSLSRLIYGKGLAATDAHQKPEQWAAFKLMFKDKEVRRVAYDFKKLGTFAFQLEKKNGEYIKATHFPVYTLLPQLADDNGDIKNYYYHPDWKDKKYNDDVEEIPAFGHGPKTGIEMYVYKGYVQGYFYFSPPTYSSGLDYAVLEEEIADYLVTDVKTSFSGRTILNFNNGVIPDEEERKKRVREVKAKLTGSSGDATIVSFNANAENQTNIEKVPLDNAPEHYKYLSEECFEKLIEVHGVTSPMLLGIRTGGDGLGNNADEIRNATLLMDNTTIKPFQHEIIDSINEILAVNDMSFDLYFKTLEPLEFIDVSEEEAETQIKEKGEELSTDKDLLQLFIDLGEDENEDWECISEEEVNEQPEEKLSLRQQLINLVSTGTARPNSKSEQDKEIDGITYRVRYQYQGAITSKTRDFCRRMLSANKLYRKEDIVSLENIAVNPGWGPGGTDKYSVWFYKGGGYCNHKWVRKTFKFRGNNNDVRSPLAETVSTNQARREGFNPVNDARVSVKPKDLPNNGFLR